MISAALAVLAILSGVLMLWQWIAAIRFPLNARLRVSTHVPTATILKPVKGADPGTIDALESWLLQEYPNDVQVCFGVESRDDPAVAPIEQLLQRHPRVAARLIICGESLGANRKVSNLIQMTREATGELLFVSDADARAPRDLLAQMAQGFADPAVGLVHCLYRLAGASTLAGLWEAWVVNADFWSQVLQNRTLGPLRYALGAAMAVRRADLDALGGFAELANHLADDNRLGRLVVALGKRTELSTVVVDCWIGPTTWAEAWRHQLRWAVTIRVCQPAPFFLSILANGTLWPLLWMSCTPSATSLTGGAVLLAFRLIQALSLEARFVGRSRDWGRWGLVLLKDILHLGLWAAALVQQHVTWRGHRFRVLRDGRLVPACQARTTGRAG